jgi:hypothetical protein
MGWRPRKYFMSVTFTGLKSNSAIMVPQGGTGVSNIPAGGVLIGQGTDAINAVVGAEGEVLTFVNGTWVGAQPTGGTGGSGGLSTVNTSGNIQGDGSSGSPVTLKSAISLTSVTASFSGNGSALTNLTASQIDGLNAAVDARITNIPNSALQNSSININGEEVALGGIFTINVPQGFGGVTTSGSISGDGLSAPITLNDNISLTSVTASFNGSGAGLTNIPNSALANSSITINGSSVSLGGSATIQTSSDSSVKTFTATGLSVGQVVALSGSLVAADKSNDLKSNAIGVVSAVSGSTVTVKLFGEVSTNGASSYTAIGTPVYVGTNGEVTNYAGLSAGNYVTQVGFISDTGKIIIQPRIFGQL